jgi:hypothetical protein
MGKVHLIGCHHDTDYSIINTDHDIELYHSVQNVSINPTNNMPKIFLQMEPDSISPSYDFLKENSNLFDYIICYNPLKIQSPNTIGMACGGTWIDKSDYLNIDISLKKFKISNLCGTKQYTHAHNLRIYLYMNQHLFNSYPITFFRCPPNGHGSVSGTMLPDLDNNPIIDADHKAKISLFKDFQYSIIIENSREAGYFSEKLIDCLITKTIPIYYGCENISEYFNTDGWIILSSDDIVQELYEKLALLNENYYNKYANIIEKNYKKALNHTCVLTTSFEAMNKIPYINVNISNFTKKHYPCIILIEDPTNNIGNPDVEWQWDTQIFVQHKEVWKKYVNFDKDILCLFMNIDNNLKKGENILDIKNNTLTVQGCHKYGNIDKPLKAFKALNNYYTYDFLLGTTSSCFWILPKLKELLLDLPKTRLYYGTAYLPGEAKYNIGQLFVSGSGILFSKDVVKLLIDNIDTLSNITTIPNDVLIGRCLHMYNIFPTQSGKRCDFESSEYINNLKNIIIDTDIHNVYYYRVKVHENRLYYDTIILHSLYNYYYGSKYVNN